MGTAEVKAVFGSGNRRVAGCLVLDGALRRDAIAVVKRGKRTVHEVRWLFVVWAWGVGPRSWRRQRPGASPPLPGRNMRTARPAALRSRERDNGMPLPHRTPQGKLSSLRRVKDDVKEVAAGTECGVAVEGFKDWEVGLRGSCSPFLLRFHGMQASSLGPACVKCFTFNKNGSLHQDSRPYVALPAALAFAHPTRSRPALAPRPYPASGRRQD